MPEQRKENIFTKFKNMPINSTPKTIFVAVVLCLFCSMIVSFAAVKLKALQQANKIRDKQINILQVAGIYYEGIDVEESFSSFEPRIVDINEGVFTDRFNPKDFDDAKAASDPMLSIELTDDPASIGRRSNFATVYLLKNKDQSIDKIILPIYGYGLWSTLYGFVALEEDGNEIFGLQFYQHAETPGLGGEVDNPKWKSQWAGKKIRNPEGDLMIQVAKTADAKEYHVDAIAGATLTSNGVHNLVRFWLGESGFNKFLTNFKNGTM
ncbi:MAG: Na(+)-translocating NADH-quinone reductase subunit C [Nitrosomonadales bacterium]|jgi:Na+-transporting NADH:ubiquinone oxidoreductase subunit C|nr:Na(+)-translocating NADH-quinone reductase subunit C [Nitrosomonadales bacterium]MBT3918296.1 Na(+)-translocating NADH-quinone reductase subunit C [Nitrosomonadales bacterium]MBT4759949.1 Na(+)-translocating NADH-quinone reductase subunit C [Nitrosomonadales bacterium]MBT6818150.1 Na(+)-translocating NADH-quinone reductase subunit C [Nitrosomonadales bacterium]MBT7689965.1 Na(+)-translocating NADH-quinone reductase subunit C [Nitrosomonadales bacterium]